MKIKTVLPPADVCFGFAAKSTTRKGALAESIVLEILRAQGYRVFQPIDADRNHAIDMVVHSKSEAIHFYFADVKCKPLRVNYPDTGINMAHYGIYHYLMEFQNIWVYLFFVDDDRGEIYGNWLHELKQPRTVIHNDKPLSYPTVETCKSGDIIYFPFEAMIHFASLTPDQQSQIKALSTRAFKYCPNDQDVLDLAVQP